jgi:glycolate oxidase iron-sulfur subunit
MSTLVPPGLFTGPDAPDESDLYKCVHCGFCLQACPTYIETGLETESPRGRIALMKAVNEGRIDVTPGVVRHWDLCIQCRACEVACPSGVPYGKLIEATMSQVQTRRKAALLTRLASNISLKHLLPHQSRLTLLFKVLRVYQRFGFQSLIRKTQMLRILPGNLSELEASLPRVQPGFFKPTGRVVQPQAEKKARVALLSGCIMPLVHGPEMSAVVRVLARNGCEVTTPEAQVCCGAINSHVGDLETARSLARRNIDVFMADGVDAVVVASAGCGIRMKEYGHLLRDDPQYAERAQQMSELVKDVHEFLVDLPFDPPKVGLDRVVTYQDSCHLANTQGVTRQPRELLTSIPGVKLVELPNAAMCCGGGGTYTLTEREMSLRVLETKMAAVASTGADILATANPGCLIQLDYGSRRAGLPLRVKYVTDLLDEAYLAEERR